MNEKMMRFFIVVVSVCAMFTMVPSVYAQDVLLPRVGRQFGVVGVSVQPGFVYDSEAEEVGQSTFTPAVGPHFVLSLQHLLTYHLMMAVEIGAGVLWLGEHTMTPEAGGESELAFAVQGGIIGRWMPWGDEVGWSWGLGSHYYRSWLSDAPLQVLAFETRLGRYLWTGDESFVLLEAGYSFPFIQGLVLPATFEDGIEEPADRTWVFHRFSVNVQYAW